MRMVLALIAIACFSNVLNAQVLGELTEIKNSGKSISVIVSSQRGWNFKCFKVKAYRFNELSSRHPLFEAQLIERSDTRSARDALFVLSLTVNNRSEIKGLNGSKGFISRNWRWWNDRMYALQYELYGTYGEHYDQIIRDVQLAHRLRGSQFCVQYSSERPSEIDWVSVRPIRPESLYLYE